MNRIDLPDDMEDLAGQRFGRLTVKWLVDDKRRGALWYSICDCGAERLVAPSRLRDAGDMPCYCKNPKLPRDPRSPDARIVKIWRGMMSRCAENGAVGEPNYAGRGISVCDEWHDLDTFIAWARANGYAADLTIDRRDNDGNYTPSNCWWAGSVDQARNTQATIWVDYKGARRRFIELVDELGIPYARTRQLMRRRNMSFEEALARLGARPR